MSGSGGGNILSQLANSLTGNMIGDSFESPDKFITNTTRLTTWGLSDQAEVKKGREAIHGTWNGITGETARNNAEKEKFKGIDEQKDREAMLANQEAKNKGATRSANMRARQRAMSGQGRQGTILTGDLGSNIGGGGKTLLGS